MPTIKELEAEISRLREENEILKLQLDTYHRDHHENVEVSRIALASNEVLATKLHAAANARIWKASEKKAYLMDRFEHYSDAGDKVGIALDRANDDMAKYFDCDPYKERRMFDILKEHRLARE